MQNFKVNDGSQPQSIGFDATERSDLVVTVGVLLNRTQEATLLDDFCETLRDDGYRPFRTKSRDLSIDAEKVHSLLLRCNGDVGICVHQDSVSLEYAEAVHSAIILDELNVATNETIAIADGDRSRADKLCQAASAINAVPPPVTNCVQSEFYYPHLLLADLVASTIADTLIETTAPLSTGSEDGPVKAVKDTTPRKGRWGRGYAAVARGEGDVQQTSYQQRYADSVKERVTCWFHGLFGKTHAPPPESDGVQPVVGRLSAMGCENVATWLDEQ